ncbi:efflux RND transporter periplasmic adaptor subunit [Aurantibacter aestuarii]|uniref:Efflux RND transporter periplasmic adaptor subunit n=1 Tax=Aurantibacter aestuarii TaxID=1266046 RepID=A0A2T1NDP3_9FLAO|nr:efflux RND transporter periplasmic adaptor subunit [Aurantibacter aestuarii]PSG90567.1 efflux RND transporter periplasmic adaptor subunit [Aurantibacter aestuarii]
MKKIITLVTLSLILWSCGGDKQEASLEAVLNSKNTKDIATKRQELVDQQQNIQQQLKQIDEALAEINPDKNVPLITTFKAKTEEFNHYVELQGNVTTKQNLVLTPEMSGILTSVYVKEGDKVRKGQLLALVDDGGLSQQKAQLQIQADLAKTTYERQKRLWDQKIGSEIQFLQAKSTYDGQMAALNQINQQLAKTRITAPFSGEIDDVITEQGSVVGAGQTPIMRIVNLNDMYIETEVPERYLANISNDSKVEVNFPVLNETVQAKVRQTGNYINPSNRTFKIEIEVPKTEKQIKPNLTARLKINDYTNKEAILIPQNIISENADGEQYIYILEDKENNKAVAKQVIIETGETQGDVIEILSGLKNNDEIIQEGARSVKEGQTVKIIN